MSIDNKIIIPPLTEEKWFVEKRNLNIKCCFWSNVVPTFEFWLRDKDYYVRAGTDIRGGVAETNIPIVPVAVATAPNPLTLDEDNNLRYYLIALIKEKVSNEIEGANALMKKLKEDCIVNSDTVEITMKDVGDEIANNALYNEKSKNLNV